VPTSRPFLVGKRIRKTRRIKYPVNASIYQILALCIKLAATAGKDSAALGMMGLRDMAENMSPEQMRELEEAMKVR
jgi:hypothetical protein